ncbi:MAG: hypothetical protein ACRD0P_38310, partial [Stackebrandtia sp.]
MTTLSRAESSDIVCVELARRLVGSERVLAGVNTPLAEAAALLAHRVTGTPRTVITGAVSGTHICPTVVRAFEGELDTVASGAAWPFEHLLL